MHIRCVNQYKTGADGGTILGQPMLFEYMDICVLRPAHEREMRSQLVYLLIVKYSLIFFKIQPQYIRLNSLIVAPQWELRTQKLKSHLVRTQSLKVLPLKSGVGQYIAIHATLIARNFFLAYFYPSGPFFLNIIFFYIQSKEIYNAMNVRSSTSLKLM